MVSNIRITYRRRHSYRTKSNRVKPVKTPGGRLVAQYIKKKCNGPRCGDCKNALPGMPCMRPAAFSRLPKSARTVSRVYGGSRCHTCVRSRILRAFLIEEQKIVKKVLQEKMKKAKQAK